MTTSERYGPLIRFLQVTTALVLDKPPSVEALRKIIQREIERREVARRNRTP